MTTPHTPEAPPRFDLAYWNDRWLQHGEFGTVCTLRSNDVTYYRGARESIEWCRRCPAAAEALIHLEHLKHGRVLDFGCGSGRFVPWLMSYAGAYHGVDLCRPAIRRAMMRYKSKAVAFGLVRPDGTIPTFGGATYDLVWCHTILQHITDDDALRATIEQLVDRLNPGGSLIAIEDCGPRAADHSRTVFRPPDDYVNIMHEARLELDHGEAPTIHSTKM